MRAQFMKWSKRRKVKLLIVRLNVNCFLKYTFLAFSFLFLFLVIGYQLFVGFYPSFGGEINGVRQATYESAKQFENGVFQNSQKSIPKGFSFETMLKISKKYIFDKTENTRPKKDILVQNVDSSNVANYTVGTRLFWFGHSSFLLQMDGKNILIDPVFSEVPAPHPWLGEKRFNSTMPIELQQLPDIDAVIISHDHYDHLDYESIKKLNDKVDTYFVPLGVGVHLEAWGVAAEKIIEMDWWEEKQFKKLQLACTPAQHFSGRKLNTRQTTLWSSWVIKSEHHSLFFSGDTGYADHFKQIGTKYGPFDFAMMECGQYNSMWPDIHMFPEETAQAGLDVKAKAIMPIHWGSFRLAMHPWTEPIERVATKAKALNIPLVTPKIGEPIELEKLPLPQTNWWK